MEFCLLFSQLALWVAITRNEIVSKFFRWVAIIIDGISLLLHSTLDNRIKKYALKQQPEIIQMQFYQPIYE